MKAVIDGDLGSGLAVNAIHVLVESLKKLKYILGLYFLLKVQLLSLKHTFDHVVANLYIKKDLPGP